MFTLETTRKTVGQDGQVYKYVKLLHDSLSFPTHEILNGGTGGTGLISLHIFVPQCDTV